MQKDLNTTQSVWIASSDPQTYPKLTTDLVVDVAIIGGGITGITAAYLLATEGKSVAVLEAHKIGKGATGYSTGNLYATVGERLPTIEKKHSQKALSAVVNSRNAAINFIEDCIAINSIDCEFNRVPWHLFTTSESSAHDPEVEAEFEKARQLELSVLNSVPPLFPFRDVSKITTLNHQAQFNPFKYVSGLAKSANTAHCQIFEN